VLDGRVVGFFLLHHYLRLEFAFIAYLVVERGKRDGDGRISQAILKEVKTLFAPGQELNQVRGVLTEVDHPSCAADDKTRMERLARIRLFCMLAESQSFALRALDLEYLQPKLTLDDPNAREVPLMLLYSPVGPGYRRGYASRAEVRSILNFVYTHLYPEGFSDVDRENRRYRSYLRGFCKQRCQLLPARIPLLEYRSLKTRVLRTGNPT
jgi:hypothetical protein